LEKELGFRLRGGGLMIMLGSSSDIPARSK